MNSRRPVNSDVMCFSFLRKLHLHMMSSAVLLALTRVVTACSGPTSEAFTEQNRSIVNRYGFVEILILAAIVGVYFLRGRVGLVIVLLAALVGFFHPIWHFGQGGSPDCGQHFAENAPYVTLTLGGLLLVQSALWLFRRRVHVAART